MCGITAGSQEETRLLKMQRTPPRWEGYCPARASPSPCSDPGRGETEQGLFRQEAVPEKQGALKRTFGPHGDASG